MRERFSFSGTGRTIWTKKPSPDGDRVVPTPSEFGRFEGLTRKLVAVPKNELDDKRNRG